MVDIKGKIALTLGALAALLGVTDAQAEEAVEEEVVEENSLFAGTIVDESTIDTVVHYKHDNGAQATGRLLVNPWMDNHTTHTELAVRSPKFSYFRLNAAANHDDPANAWSLVGFLEAFPIEELMLRAGYLQDSEDAIGGFLGGKFSNDFLTAAIELQHNSKEFDMNGYSSLLLGKVYLSIGGNLGQKAINTIQGWIDPPNFGVYNQVRIDIDDKVQKGKLVIADKFNYTREKFDFRNLLYTGGEVSNYVGYVLAGVWAPFDAFMTDSISLVVNWQNDEKATNVRPQVFYRALEQGLFFGLGGNYHHDKSNDSHDGHVVAELYLAIPKTPLEAWTSTDINVKTGDIVPVFYIGGSGEF